LGRRIYFVRSSWTTPAVWDVRAAGNLTRGDLFSLTKALGVKWRRHAEEKTGLIKHMQTAGNFKQTISIKHFPCIDSASGR